MTASQKTYIKETWKGWLTVANFLILIVIMLFKSGFMSGKEITQMKQDTKVNTAAIVEALKHLDVHISNEIVHMPFEKKIEIFVPRVELDSRLLNIEKALARIENNQQKAK